MGIIVKRGLQVSVISYIGVAIGTFNILYLYPKYLTPEEVGIFNFLQEAAFFFSSFFLFGLNGAILKYFPRYNHSSGMGGLFNIVFSLLIPITGFFTLIYWIFNDYFQDVFFTGAINDFGLLIYILALVLVVWYLSESVLLGGLRSDITNINKEIVLRIIIAIAVIFYFLNFISQEVFFISPIIAYGVISGITLWYIFRQGLFKLKKPLFSFDKSLFKEFRIFTFFTFMGLLSTLLYSKIDTFMITAMLGVTEFGIFKIPFFIATIIELPRRIIMQISAPIISTAWKQNDRITLNGIYKKSALNLFILGSILFLGIWMNTDFIFFIMPNSEEYQAGLYIILFIGLARLVDLGTGLNAEIIAYSEKFKVNLLLAILMIIPMILGNLWLIPIMGIEGAALATLAVVIFLNAGKFLYIFFTFKLSPFSIDYLKSFIIFTLIWLTVSFFHFENIWINTILKSFMIGIFYPGLLYILHVSEEMNALVDKYLKK